MSNDKARQTEVNKEIILLRQFVRRTRICVISRLVREAKKLRGQRGNEKQLERNKKKADKLLREVFALKDIKDDEISKFGIINIDNLQDMLNDPGTEDGTKAMIKIARHKHLNEKILKFKEKFPDYREFVRERKVIAVANGRGNRTRNARNIEAVGAHKERRKRKDTRIVVTDADHPERAALRQKNNNGNDNGERFDDESSTPKEQLEGKESMLAVKVISKEATVKRFAEALEETDTREESSEREEKNDRRTSDDAADRRKRIDDFFLSFDEADSSDVVPLVENNEDRRVSELDHRPFNAVPVKIKEKTFCKDSREKRETGKKGRMRSKDLPADGPSNGRKMSVTRFEGNGNTRFEKTSRLPKRHIDDTIEAKEDNLHPSWAARKKQQEMMKQGFQGKKIKFEEY